MYLFYEYILGLVLTKVFNIHSYFHIFTFQNFIFGMDGLAGSIIFHLKNISFNFGKYYRNINHAI